MINKVNGNALADVHSLFLREYNDRCQDNW